MIGTGRLQRLHWGALEPHVLQIDSPPTKGPAHRRRRKDAVKRRMSVATLDPLSPQSYGASNQTEPVDHRRRVLLVGTFLSSSFANYSVGEDLAKRLAEAGWHVIVTSTKIARMARLLDMLMTTWQRRKDYAVAQVDVYSGLAFGWAEAVCWTLQRAGKPYVLTLHGGNLPMFAQRWPGRVCRLLKSAATVTAPSHFLFEQMAPYGSDVQLLPNPLHLDQYVFHLRKQSMPRLIWLRSFHEVYNPTMAPHVVAHLKPLFPDIRLVMVGPDKGDGSFQQTQNVTRQLGLETHITFPGGIPHDDVSRWLQTGDILINTTNVDNTPVSVLEAMACGLCIVSTNVGGLPYLLEHEHDALLVPPRNPEAMAVAIQRVLQEPGLSQKLSTNARHKAERFGWKEILPQWEAILTSAASKSRVYDESKRLSV